MARSFQADRRDVFQTPRRRCLEVIYFIEAIGGNAVKVGYTGKDPFKRLRELAVGNHCELLLLGIIPGPQAREGTIHVALGSKNRIRGEWFTKESVMRFLEQQGEKFVPGDRILDPELGSFCESGAFVSF